jgi:hypothetical protein
MFFDGVSNRLVVRRGRSGLAEDDDSVGLEGVPEAFEGESPSGSDDSLALEEQEASTRRPRRAIDRPARA